MARGRPARSRRRESRRFALDTAQRASGGRILSVEAHWDEIYERLGPGRVSWAQAAPTCSLELIARFSAPTAGPIVDVGGGTSRLGDELVSRGYRDLTVVDLSAVALVRSRERLGAAPGAVRWIHGDVLSWRPDRSHAVWHDRAVFHFLVSPADRERYLATLRAALRPSGYAIVATFAPDGPERCSGLAVVRYDAADLADAFGPGFELVESRREEHTTPAGSVQPFTWAVLRHAGG